MCSPPTIQDPFCSLRLSHVENWGKHLQGRQFTSDIANKDEVQKWLQEQDVFVYCQCLKTLIMHCDKCLKKLNGFVEELRTYVIT